MKKSAVRCGTMYRLTALFILILAVVMLAVVPSSWAKSKALRFRVVPATPLSDPQQAVIRVGELEISRAEFAFYLNEFLAFPEKGDLLQRNYLYHYALITKLAARYPQELDDLIWRAMINGKMTPENRAVLNKWVVGQAGLYGRMKALAARHQLGQFDRQALDTYIDSLYAEELGEVVRRGGLVPDRAGVVAFFEKLKPEEKRDLEQVLRSPETIKPYEQDDLEKRWSDYQKALAESLTVDRPYQKMKSLSAVGIDARLVGVGQLNVTYQEFLAIHGKPVNDANWNKIKGSRLSQVVAIKTLATEARSVGMNDEQLQKRIELAQLLYFVADWAASQYDQTTLASGGPGFNDEYFARLSQKAHFLEFNAWFHRHSKEIPPLDAVWVDTEFLQSVEWKVMDLQETDITSRILTNPFSTGAMMSPEQTSEPERNL